MGQNKSLSKGTEEEEKLAKEPKLDLEVNEEFVLVNQVDKTRYVGTKKSVAPFLNRYVCRHLIDEYGFEVVEKGHILARENENKSSLVVFLPGLSKDQGTGILSFGVSLSRNVVEGSWIQYLQKMKDRTEFEDFSYLILQYNGTKSEDEFMLKVWNNIMVGYEKIIFVAHSYGGCVLINLLNRSLKFEEYEKKVKFIAFVGSAHEMYMKQGVVPKIENEDVKRYINERTTHWAESDKELDEELGRDSVGIRRVSSSTPKHAHTVYASVDSVVEAIKKNSR